MPAKALDKILLCGHGLAFEFALVALSKNLPDAIEITALELSGQADTDAFYGNVVTPEAYKFHLSLGLTEPELILQTNTAFSYGTYYENWGGNLSWAQSHNLPLPIWENIPFHHYLTKTQKPLAPYLVGAISGMNGKFAHPPEDSKIPLSRAEYGYQIRPASLAAFMAKRNHPVHITRIKGAIKNIRLSGEQIKSVELETGQTFGADLFIDASGPDGVLMTALDNQFQGRRKLGVMESCHARPFAGKALRQVKGETFGWQSIATMQGAFSKLTVFHPDDEDKAAVAHNAENECQHFTITTGRRSSGWVSNCAAIGQASYITEPLTPAPMMLLQRDIERLLSLIPPTTDMGIEAREFNRLLGNDLEHSELFGRAFFELPNSPATPYWQDALSFSAAEKLDRKLRQFESRGYLTAFDLEPFNEQDWTILHFGMGRKARRYDIPIDNYDIHQIEKNLNHLETSIQKMTDKMPPHDRYLENFRRYLEKKYAEQRQ